MKSLRRYASTTILILVCLFFLTLRWKKMDSLLWLDPARWTNEMSRVAHGEMPYRDFSFQYPPFYGFFYGWLLRIFGVRFTTLQAAIDAIGIGVIACCYVLIRKLLPEPLRVATACFLVAVCATSLMNFNLFSFVTYSTSLQTGALGVLLLLFALLGLARDGRLGAGGWILAACGGFIAALSKPESGLAAVAGIAMLALITRRFRMAFHVALVAFAPAMVCYALLAKIVGLANLRAGISGYGLATAFCPWWPTGLGVFGVLAALGEAAAIAALFSLPKWRTFRSRFGARYSALLLIALVGSAIEVAYVFYQNVDAITSPTRPWIERVRLVLPSLIYTSAILQPVLWTCITVFCFLTWRVIVRRRARTGDAELLLILTMPVVMSVRSLFGTTQSAYPEVAAICYPFLLVLGPYFLWRFLNAGGAPQYAAAVVLTLTIGYAVVRTVGGWSELLSDARYGTLQTAAGSVKLLNYDVDSKIYAYIMAHTSPDDYVLDLPYGGGMNFATGRPYPIFNTQLYGIGVPAAYEQLDIEKIEQHPPRLVIAQDEPHLGTFWGFGNRGYRACPCPRLVWIPDGRSFDPGRVLRVAAWVEDRYRVTARIGNKAIWAPR